MFPQHVHQSHLTCAVWASFSLSAPRFCMYPGAVGDTLCVCVFVWMHISVCVCVRARTYVCALSGSSRCRIAGRNLR